MDWVVRDKKPEVGESRDGRKEPPQDPGEIWTNRNMNRPQLHLILASRSPRRRELLAEGGYSFEVVFPSEEAECGARDGESPRDLVARLARQKAADVVGRRSAGLVLGCDTVAECRDAILGKPNDLAHAREMLRSLRGQAHHVLSGLCLWPVGGEPDVRVARTTLVMDDIPDEAIEEYLNSRLWEGKAGAFGLQDRQGWIHIVEGSASNVVGLPMELLDAMLRDHERSL